jgi:uncharacterized protein YgbK (DUF1537 family)
VVVNATNYADLEVVALGLLEVQDGGREFLCRVGPSFPSVMAGLPVRPPLTPTDLWPHGRPPGHGLVVVGSHVGLTSRQVGIACRRHRLATIELQVSALLGDRRQRHVADVTSHASAALAGSDVLVVTSRA